MDAARYSAAWGAVARTWAGAVFMLGVGLGGGWLRDQVGRSMVPPEIRAAGGVFTSVEVLGLVGAVLLAVLGVWALVRVATTYY